MEIVIKKAKLNKNGTLETVYTDADGNEIAMKGKNKCHNDLKVAFACLVPYFADLTEQKEADSIDWSALDDADNVDLLRRIDVTGVSISGDSGNRIITLTGRRTLFTSRVLNLNAPGVEMDSEVFEWDHIDDFDIAVQNLIYEVKEYIVSRKWEIAQTLLDFNGDPDDPFNSTEPTNDAPPIEEPAEHVA